MTDPAQFVYVADVFCPWCYGFAPIMKRIASEHPDFSVHVLGGNLVSRPITLLEDVQQSPDLVDFWREVERATGRSLRGAISAVEEGRNVRLFSPGADEILAVLKKFAPGHELEQLFELEDIFYGQGRDMFTNEALDNIATHWGIDAAAFETALDQPAAIEATSKNLREAATVMGEITSYPSVFLRRGNKIDAVSRGFVRYETVAGRLEDVMRDLGVTLEDGAYCTREQACTLGKSSRK